MSVAEGVGVREPQTASVRWTEERVTESWLGYLVLAGPLYVAVSLIQAVLPPGFDLGRDEWSLLADGRAGWIQMANLAVTGAMVVAGAVGLGRALRHVGRSRAAWLLGGYGTDPAGGFAPGTPAGRAVHLSWHGLGHVAAGSLGFVCLIAACFVLAGHFRRAGRRTLAVRSRTVGAAFTVAFAGIATADINPAVNLSFTAAVVLVSGWVAVVGVHVYRHALGDSVLRPTGGETR